MKWSFCVLASMSHPDVTPRPEALVAASAGLMQIRPRLLLPAVTLLECEKQFVHLKLPRPNPKLKLMVDEVLQSCIKHNCYTEAQAVFAAFADLGTATLCLLAQILARGLSGSPQLF